MPEQRVLAAEHLPAPADPRLAVEVVHVSAHLRVRDVVIGRVVEADAAAHVLGVLLVVRLHVPAQVRGAATAGLVGAERAGLGCVSTARGRRRGGR